MDQRQRKTGRTPGGHLGIPRTLLVNRPEIEDRKLVAIFGQGVPKTVRRMDAERRQTRLPQEPPVPRQGDERGNEMTVTEYDTLPDKEVGQMWELAHLALKDPTEGCWPQDAIKLIRKL